MTQRLGNMQDGDMRHKHVSLRPHDIGRRLLVAPVPVVLVISFFVYFFVALVFACLFLLAPSGCYDTDSYGFATMLWLSIHTISTVGFGSPYIYDSCAGPQVLVLLESYLSLIVSSTIGGYVFTSCMRTRPRVVFSKWVLLTRRYDLALTTSPTAARPPHGGQGIGRFERRSSGSIDVMRSDEKRRRSHDHYIAASKQQKIEAAPAPASDAGEVNSGPQVVDSLTLRMVTCEKGSLRDVHARMQATIWSQLGSDGGGRRASSTVNKGSIVTLKLEQDYFAKLEQLQLTHLIDKRSPLYDARQNMSRGISSIDSIDISLTAFDVKTLQEVKYFHRYERKDLIEFAEFDVMFGLSDTGGLECDHSKLDKYTMQVPDDAESVLDGDQLIEESEPGSSMTA